MKRLAISILLVFVMALPAYARIRDYENEAHREEDAYRNSEYYREASTEYDYDNAAAEQFDLDYYRHNLNESADENEAETYYNMGEAAERAEEMSGD